MKVEDLNIPGVKLITPNVFGDERGFFMETWQIKRYAEVGLPETWLQDNMSRSGQGVLRGLHFQHPHGQGKLVSVIEGEVFDVAVDIRVGSPTFGQYAAVTLTGENRKQFWVPAGFAHGFQVVSESALFAYKCTELYHPETEGSVLWNDPDIGIPWPISDPKLSKKDEDGLPLSQIPKEQLPQYVS